MSKSGQARTDQGISNQDMVSSAQVVKSGQVRFRTGLFRSCSGYEEVRLGYVRSGQDKDRSC